MDTGKIHVSVYFVNENLTTSLLQPRTEVVGKVAPLFRNGIFPSEPNKISPNLTFPNKDVDPHPPFQCWILNAQFMPDETQHCLERGGKGKVNKASQHFCLWL